MNKKVKFLVGGLVGVVVLGAVYFGAGGGLQGKIELNKPIIRAEMVKMIAVKMADLSKVSIPVAKDTCGYSDIKVADWYTPYICYLVSEKMLNNGSGKFGPGQNITRAEGMKFIVSAYYYFGPIPAQDNLRPAFTDVAANVWYYGFIQNAAEEGLTDIKPRTSAKFYPNDLLSKGRAQNLVNIWGSKY